ncbi:MAG TPA: hypothetical protein VLB86_13555 [Gaiellaceae bacterium]|nr:hypothetical protein [Gaiellaceae bacterium]
MNPRTTDERRAAVRLAGWRRDELARSGFPLDVAARVAREPGWDPHLLIELVERGCPPVLALRIAAPLEPADVS